MSRMHTNKKRIELIPSYSCPFVFVRGLLFWLT
jgi:hypothetical protein